MDVREPIEGVLISEDEKRNAPLLQIEVQEGLPEMVGAVLKINA